LESLRDNGQESGHLEKPMDDTSNSDLNPALEKLVILRAKSKQQKGKKKKKVKIKYEIYNCRIVTVEIKLCNFLTYLLNT
jgi:hypothetical protein